MMIKYFIYIILAHLISIKSHSQRFSSVEVQASVLLVDSILYKEGLNSTPTEAVFILRIDSCSIPFEGKFCVARLEKSKLEIIDDGQAHKIILKSLLSSPRNEADNALERIKKIPPMKMHFSLTSSNVFLVEIIN